MPGPAFHRSRIHVAVIDKVILRGYIDCAKSGWTSWSLDCEAYLSSRNSPYALLLVALPPCQKSNKPIADGVHGFLK